jgi:type VI secretion system ImpB/VipA family protein
VDIDKDNFDQVLGSVCPRVAYSVDNKLTKGGNTNINVELRFRTIEDFEPLNVVKQVAPLQKLFEARGKLSDLLAKLDGNDELDSLLQDVVANTDSLKQLKAAAGGTPNA